MPTTRNTHRTARALALADAFALGLALAPASSWAVAVDTPQQAKPSAPAPASTPPLPPSAAPAPPAAQPMEAHPQPGMTPPASAYAGPAPTGQWVYTQQYGWLWMPYDQRYTYVDDNAAVAYEYVWYPTFGWNWVVAPWILGFGVTPFWGGLGPAHFAWYAHPWFRVGTAHLHPTWGPGTAARGGFGHGFRAGGHGRR